MSSDLVCYNRQCQRHFSEHRLLRSRVHRTVMTRVQRCKRCPTYKHQYFGRADDYYTAYELLPPTHMPPKYHHYRHKLLKVGCLRKGEMQLGNLPWKPFLPFLQKTRMETQSTFFAPQKTSQRRQSQLPPLLQDKPVAQERQGAQRKEFLDCKVIVMRRPRGLASFPRGLRSRIAPWKAALYHHHHHYTRFHQLCMNITTLFRCSSTC
jgi:hypothetical protein